MTPLQLTLLAALTLVWGLNWPIMKLGIADYPPLTFRAISMWLGLPVLGLALVVLKVPFRVARAHWRELFWLAAANMFFWHACIILAVGQLTSGRAAILGYTMPIFSALIGAWLFRDRLSPRGWLGVGAATLGVLLLLWHEFTGMSGKPLGVLLALVAASTWALGTHLLRRTKIPAQTLTLSFWMTVQATLVMTLLAVLFEQPRWRMPPPATSWAIAFTADTVLLDHARKFCARDQAVIPNALTLLQNFFESADLFYFPEKQFFTNFFVNYGTDSDSFLKQTFKDFENEVMDEMIR